MRVAVWCRAYAGSKSIHLTLWLRGEAKLVWDFGVLGFESLFFIKSNPFHLINVGHNLFQIFLIMTILPKMKIFKSYYASPQQTRKFISLGNFNKIFILLSDTIK